MAQDPIVLGVVQTQNMSLLLLQRFYFVLYICNMRIVNSSLPSLCQGRLANASDHLNGDFSL